MEVAYLINQYPTVSHTFIRREIAALERMGVVVHRFSIRPPRNLVDEADREEASRTDVVLSGGIAPSLFALAVTLLRRPGRVLRALASAWRLGRRSDRGRLRHLAYLAEAAWLARQLSRRGVNHLHAHFGTNPATVAMLCREVGGPRFSFTVHGPEEFDKPEALGLSEKIMAAEFVVAISSFGRSQLWRRIAYRDWPKVHVVRCVVDGGYLSAAVVPLPDAPRLACIGRVCEQKGQALLIEAARRLAGEGIWSELVLVGDGEMRPEIEALIARHGLSDRVRITGWCSGSEVLRHLQDARALVLPSFAEGLPVAIMEAFALCRPVISTAVAGIPELVRDGVNGWLITAGDIDALVEAMRSALRCSHADLERMGAAGRAAVEAMHRAEPEARKLAALFAASVSGSGSSG